MASSVFFRFKSQKEPSRITFDGTGISVFELKRDIIAASKLGDGTDLELIITAEDTNEEYDDDTAIVPRSTTVIAKRLPAAKPGRGGAARYVSGKMPQNARSSNKIDHSASKHDNHTKSNTEPQQTAVTDSAQTEEQRIAAMFQQGAEQWAQQQQTMANATPVFRPHPNPGKQGNIPDKPLPPGYICYRCGEKGHYIQACPTNNDPEWDKRPRIKRTTGIPKSFLKTIEKPTVMANDGTVDDTKQPSGVMVTADGEWVVAEPDKASWDQFQAKAQVSAAAQEAAARGSKELRERGLECSIDNRLFIDPTKTPCCQTTYCNECITNSLLENDLTCPTCSTENILIDDLLPDEEISAKIREYEKETAPEQPRREASHSPKKQASETKKEASESGSPSSKHSPASSGTDMPKITAAVPGTSEDTKGKKRRAESELQNDRSPLGPSAAAMVKPSLKSDGKQSVPVPKAEKPANTPQTPQLAFGNTTYVMPPGLNAMAFPNMNGFMGMPLQMNTGLFNPAMSDATAFMNGVGGSWNNMWGQNYPQQAMGTSGSGFQHNVYPTTGYNMNNMHTPTSNGYHGTNGSGGQGHGRGQFPNQQRSHFHGQNDEDSAYFRKPVNPHRHQGRRNVNRPADYREV